MKTIGSVAFAAFVSICAACSGEPAPAPAPPPRASAPTPPPSSSADAANQLAPFPYTTEQIRDASRPGRTYTFRVEAAGKPIVLRTITFMKADAVGYEIQTTMADETGKELERPPATSGPWEELHQHAAFPLDQTKVTDGEIATPAGKFACLVYVVDDKKGGVDTFYFAKDRPGAPVMFFHEEKGQRAMTSTLVAYRSGGEAEAAVKLAAKPIALPGATGPAFLDYIAYEPGASRVWVPVGSTGSVDVLDVASGSFTRVDGFTTAVREGRGQKRTVGPSAVSIGGGFAFIGNRATNEVCPIDLKTLKTGKCLKLASPTDGVAYVAPAKEVWVTTPSDRSLAIVDASKPSALKLKTTVKTDGEPEGYAVDEAHGRFFTNLEDKDRTVAIDLKTHTAKAIWNPSCGEAGPRGIAYDAAHDFVIVACTDHVQVLDAAHDGAPLGRMETGGGVDNVDYRDGKLYVAAGRSARLFVAKLDDKGQLTAIATGDTSPGARNAVADSQGNAYVADAQNARVIVVSAPKP